MKLPGPAQRLKRIFSGRLATVGNPGRGMVFFRKIGHEAINLATKDLDPLLFEGVWTGSEEDDVYPVSLLIRWPNGDQQSAFIGNYTVDSTPPDIDLYIKWLSFNGLVTFRDQIFSCL